MLRKLRDATKAAFPEATIYVASLQWNPTKISSKQVGALEDLNECLVELENIHVLPKLSGNDFEIDHTDKYGIHWSVECANKMLDNWFSALDLN